MGLNIPAAPPVTANMFRLTIIGEERLILKLRRMHNSIRRSRTAGVDRVGKYLFGKKREDCKAGLYSGQEVAPNKWRYGWKYLGGPAIYEFTGAVLKAHELGNRTNADIDVIDVSVNVNKAPHAALIHGMMHSTAGAFTSPMMKRLVKTRPWMRATDEERLKARNLIVATYIGK